MNRYKNEIGDTVWLMLMQGLTYVAPLLVWPYLMRVLGAEKFGYIGFAQSVMMFLMLLVDFGFNLTATKRIALAKDNQQELNHIFSATIYAKLFLLLISLVLLFIIAFIPRFAIYRSTLFVMFLMVVGNTFSCVWLFQGLGKIRIISIINAVVKLSILPLCFFFVKSSDDVLSAAFIQGMVYLLSAFISISLIAKNKWVSFLPLRMQAVSSEMKDSFPVFLSSAASSVYLALFIVILAYFSNPVEVGKYTAVEKIMRAGCYLIFTPVAQSFYPKISSMSISHNAESLLLIRKILFFFAVCMCLLGFVLFFAATPITRFLGGEYAGTERLFRIMAVIPLLISIGGITGQLGLLALGHKEEKNAYQNVYFIAGIIAIISIAVLAPLFQSVGAAFALLLTELVVCLLMSRNYWKYIVNMKKNNTKETI